MNKQEYENKLQELREERDFHEKEYKRLMEEMDRLETDQKFVDTLIGEYIIIDKKSEGGYKDYFHVHMYEKRPRGVTLYGKGFNINDKGDFLHISDAYFLSWTDFDKITNISVEEFHDALDEYMNTIRLNIVKYTEHKDMGDEFEFKRKLLDGDIKIIWKD